MSEVEKLKTLWEQGFISKFEYESRVEEIRIKNLPPEPKEIPDRLKTPYELVLESEGGLWTTDLAQSSDEGMSLNL